MKQFNFLYEKYFLNAGDIADILAKHSFRTIKTRDSYALLAIANHNLAMDFAILGEGSALLQESDCFECLSPHEIAA